MNDLSDIQDMHPVERTAKLMLADLEKKGLVGYVLIYVRDPKEVTPLHPMGTSISFVHSTDHATYDEIMVKEILIKRVDGIY